jgi:hypothetical protein
MVAANTAPEDDDLRDAIEALETHYREQGWARQGITINDLLTSPGGAGLELDKKWRRSIPHRFERCGYIACRNPQSTDGRWTIAGKNQRIYVPKTLPAAQRTAAAKARASRKYGGEPW